MKYLSAIAATYIFSLHIAVASPAVGPPRLSLSTMLLRSTEIELESRSFEESISAVAQKFENETSLKLDYSIDEPTDEKPFDDGVKWKGRYIGLLQALCEGYGYSLEFDIEANSVTFVEVRNSGRNRARRRTFWIDPKVAKDLGFAFPLKLDQAHDRFLELGCLVDATLINGNLLTADGTPFELRKFEMLLHTAATRQRLDLE